MKIKKSFFYRTTTSWDIPNLVSGPKFMEKLNISRLLISFQWKHNIYYGILSNVYLTCIHITYFKNKFCMIYFEVLARMEAWWRWTIGTNVTCLQWASFLVRFFLRVTNSTFFMWSWSSSRGQRNKCWKMSSSKSFNMALRDCIIYCRRYRWCQRNHQFYIICQVIQKYHVATSTVLINVMRIQWYLGQ